MWVHDRPPYPRETRSEAQGTPATADGAEPSVPFSAPHPAPRGSLIRTPGTVGEEPRLTVQQSERDHVLYD